VRKSWNVKHIYLHWVTQWWLWVGPIKQLRIGSAADQLVTDEGGLSINLWRSFLLSLGTETKKNTASARLWAVWNPPYDDFMDLARSFFSAGTGKGNLKILKSFLLFTFPLSFYGVVFAKFSRITLSFWVAGRFTCHFPMSNAAPFVFSCVHDSIYSPRAGPAAFLTPLEAIERQQHLRWEKSVLTWNLNAPSTYRCPWKAEKSERKVVSQSAFS